MKTEALPGTGGATRAAAISDSTCPYCGVGCGVRASVTGDTVAVEGISTHPANRGRLCSKGSALAETLSLDDRLLYPEIHGRRASWNEALDLVAARFQSAIAEYGPDSVAFYVSGQLLTEDYYVANKLMKGFIGSGNIDTNSRLCMASSVAGHRRAFGADMVPGTYEDLELADLVVLVGSNLAWCHPVLFQRLMAAKAARPAMRVVVIDPRRTATAEAADLFLPVRPDGDVALFNGLLTHLAQTGALDAAYITQHTEGLDGALAAAATDIAATARITGLDEAAIGTFFDLFVRTERVVTVYSQGVNQSVAGTSKVNAIINCHLATGRIGRPGMGPFSVTGQPNAMGGREAGGLANMLAAHMDFDAASRDRVRRFWNAPRVAENPGLKAVELFEAVHDGRIKALWIMGTNPAVSMPDAGRVRAALRACPFVAVSDVVRSDTLALAHVALPAAAWGEKDGTVTNSERRISRQRPFLPLPGQALPDWRIVTGVARRLGFAEAFPYTSPAEIFREHAALSGFENEGARAFDIGGLADLTDEDYQHMAPVQWPVWRGHEPGGRFFAEGGFFTPDRRARLVPTPHCPEPDSGELTLNTGRIRDQWHTMTRTAKTPRLLSHIAEPFAEINTLDAARLGIKAATLVKVESAFGSAVLRAQVTDRQQPGSVFAPMHWTADLAPAGRIGGTVSPERDPVSGQPGLKRTMVRISPLRPAWYGFAVSVARPRHFGLTYQALARARGGWRMELADDKLPQDWLALVRELFGLAECSNVLIYQDNTTGHHRFAVLEDDRLVAALFTGREPVAVSRSWLIDQLGGVLEEPANRLKLLAGRAGVDMPDPGATVCACFDVGVNTITRAIASGEAVTVEAVGALLKAGTNCGSCRSEIGRLCHEHHRARAG